MRKLKIFTAFALCCYSLHGSVQIYELYKTKNSKYFRFPHGITTSTGTGCDLSTNTRTSYYNASRIDMNMEGLHTVRKGYTFVNYESVKDEYSDFYYCSPVTGKTITGRKTVKVIDFKWSKTLPANICKDEGSLNLVNYLSFSTGVKYSGTWVRGSICDPSDIRAGLHTITASRVFKNGTKKLSFSIGIDDAPQPIRFTPPKAVCSGSPAVDLTNHIVTSAGKFSGIGITGNMFNPKKVGKFSVTHTRNIKGKCARSKTAVINVTPTFTASIDGDFTICEQQTTILTGSPDHGPSANKMTIDSRGKLDKISSSHPPR